MIGEVLDYGDRASWVSSRRTAIGASEVAALFGLSPWDTRVSLWAKKTGRLEDNLQEQEHIIWGNLLEPAIATRYEQVTGRKVVQIAPYAVAQHPTIPFLRATPDRWVVDAERPGAGLVQIKNTNAFTGHDWNEGPPIFIEIQVQSEMACTGRDWDSVAALKGGCKFYTMDIERNQTFIDEMEEQARAFWWHVEHDKMPPADDGTERTLEVIKKLHPNDNGQTVQLDAAALAHWQELEAAKVERKAAEARETAAETALRLAIGDATLGELPDGRILSLRSSTRAGYRPEPVAECTYRVLRFSKKDQPKTKGSRR